MDNEWQSNYEIDEKRQDAAQNQENQCDTSTIWNSTLNSSFDENEANFDQNLSNLNEINNFPVENAEFKFKTITFAKKRLQSISKLKNLAVKEERNEFHPEKIQKPEKSPVKKTKKDEWLSGYENPINQHELTYIGDSCKDWQEIIEPCVQDEKTDTVLYKPVRSDKINFEIKTSFSLDVNTIFDNSHVSNSGNIKQEKNILDVSDDINWKSGYEKPWFCSTLNDANINWDDTANPSFEENLENKSCGSKSLVKNPILAKKRLQAYTIASKLKNISAQEEKLKNLKIKQEKIDDMEEMHFGQKEFNQNNKKGLYHDDIAKATIKDIEEIKKAGGVPPIQCSILQHHNYVPLHKNQSIPAIAIIKMDAVPNINKFGFVERRDVVDKARSRSQSPASSGEDHSSFKQQFKKREIKCRNIRRGESNERKSPSPGIPLFRTKKQSESEKSEITDKEKEKIEKKYKDYPKNWAEYKSLNLDPDKHRYIKSKLYKQPRDKQLEIQKFFTFESPPPLISDYECRSRNGNNFFVPFQYLKYTATSPSIVFSRRAHSEPGYLTREQLLSIVSNECKDILQKTWNSSKRCQPSNKKIESRKWYPKNWKKSETSEAKILENSVGLSFLQTYSDDEDDIEEFEEDIEELEDESPQINNETMLDVAAKQIHSQTKDILLSVTSPKVCKNYLHENDQDKFDIEMNDQKKYEGRRERSTEKYDKIRSQEKQAMSDKYKNCKEKSPKRNESSRESKLQVETESPKNNFHESGHEKDGHQVPSRSSPKKNNSSDFEEGEITDDKDEDLEQKAKENDLKKKNAKKKRQEEKEAEKKRKKEAGRQRREEKEREKKRKEESKERKRKEEEEILLKQKESLKKLHQNNEVEKKRKEKEDSEIKCRKQYELDKKNSLDITMSPVEGHEDYDKVKKEIEFLEASLKFKSAELIAEMSDHGENNGSIIEDEEDSSKSIKKKKKNKKKKSRKNKKKQEESDNSVEEEEEEEVNMTKKSKKKTKRQKSKAERKLKSGKKKEISKKDKRKKKKKKKNYESEVSSGESESTDSEPTKKQRRKKRKNKDKIKEKSDIDSSKERKTSFIGSHEDYEEDLKFFADRLDNGKNKKDNETEKPTFKNRKDRKSKDDETINVETYSEAEKQQEVVKVDLLKMNQEYLQKQKEMVGRQKEIEENLNYEETTNQSLHVIKSPMINQSFTGLDKKRSKSKDKDSISKSNQKLKENIIFAETCDLSQEDKSQRKRQILHLEPVISKKKSRLQNAQTPEVPLILDIKKEKSSEWEREEQQKFSKSNRTWESDDYSIDRSLDSIKHSTPSCLEIPLNIKQYSKRGSDTEYELEIIRSDDLVEKESLELERPTNKHLEEEMTKINVDGISLTKEKRSLELEQLKIKNLEEKISKSQSIQYEDSVVLEKMSLEKVKLKELEKVRKTKVDTDVSSSKRRRSKEKTPVSPIIIEKSKRVRWDSQSGPIASTPKHETSSFIDLSNNSTTVVLENEYEEFLKAVNTTIKDEKESIVIDDSSDQEESEILGVKERKKKSENRNEYKQHNSIQVSSDLPVMQIPLPPLNIDEIPTPVEIKPKLNPTVPGEKITVPVDIKPVPAPLSKVETVIDINKPLINLSLSANVTQNITLSLATTVSSIPAPVTSTINISKANVEISTADKDTFVTPLGTSDVQFSTIPTIVSSGVANFSFPQKLQEELCNPNLIPTPNPSDSFAEKSIDRHANEPEKKKLTLRLSNKRQLLGNSGLNLDESDDDETSALEEKKKKKLAAMIADNQREKAETSLWDLQQQAIQYLKMKEYVRDDRNPDEDAKRRDSSPQRDKLKDALRKRDSSPRNREKSPKRRDSSPRRHERSPRRRDNSPRRKDQSPRRRGQSPRRGRDESPRRKGDLSPRRRQFSPKRRDRSPRRRDGSPRRRELSPRRRGDGSPRRKGDLSPRRRDSPKRRDPSPRGRRSPRRLSPRRRSPAPGRWSPSRRSKSPRRRSISPHRRRSISPRKRSFSPRRISPRRTNSPRRSSVSPRRSNMSPWGASISPRRSSISPRRRLSPLPSLPSQGNMLMADSLRSPRRWRSPSPQYRNRSPMRGEFQHDNLGSPSRLARNRSPPPSHFTFEEPKHNMPDSTISDDVLQQRAAQEAYAAEIAQFHHKFREPEYDSPKRLPLDVRINQVLGIETTNEPPPPQKISTFPRFEPHIPPPPYNQYQQEPAPAPPSREPKGTKQFRQVGNMLQILPNEEEVHFEPLAHSPSKLQPNTPAKKDQQQQIVQMGNVLEIVPRDIVMPLASIPVPGVPLPNVVLPSPPVSSVPKFNAPVPKVPASGALVPPLIPQVKIEPPEECKPSILLSKLEKPAEISLMQKVTERRAEREDRRLDKEQRRKEKEQKRAEREIKKQARIKVKTEKMIKKALEIELEEGMEDENAENTPIQWPPVPIVFHTSDKIAGKSILVNRLGNDSSVQPECNQLKSSKLVHFADGVRPGDGTSPSAGEELHSPPAKMPKEKRYVKSKIKKKSHKKKVKVKIIKKQVTPEESDSEEDILPPPSPPPGSPPPHIFPPRIKTTPINNVTAAYLATIIQNSQQLQQQQLQQQQLQQQQLQQQQLQQQQLQQQQLQQQQYQQQQQQYPQQQYNQYGQFQSTMYNVPPTPISLIMAPPPPPPPQRGPSTTSGSSHRSSHHTPPPPPHRTPPPPPPHRTPPPPPPHRTPPPLHTPPPPPPPPPHHRPSGRPYYAPDRN